MIINSNEKLSHVLNVSEVEPLVWYHIELDIIFMSSEVDACFYGICPLNWEKLVLLGRL